MNRKASILAILMFLLQLAAPGVVHGQAIQPSPDVRHLDMWSQLQKPEPLPEARPETAPVSGTPREQQPDQQPGQQVNADDQRESSIQSITGTIVRDHDKYVLKAWDKKIYQVDDQDKAKKYEGKLVKIVGSVELSTNTIHIQSIELKS